jgi:transcriptional regulator with XRE-family HTH domain
MNTSKLEKLINESKLSKTDICAKCGFTRPTLDNALAGADVKVSTVSSLAAFFRVPVGYFFDESDTADLSNELDVCKKEIQQLKGIVEKSKASHVFLAVPIDDDEFLDLREMKDKVIRILSK